VFWIVGRAIWRVGEVAVESFDMPWTAAHWIFAAVWVVFMGYSEGYRGFQQRFAPRVVVRAMALARKPTLIRGLLAPLFCIGFFGARRRRVITAWVITALIVVIVLGVKQAPQPWRGIVDLGVVIGLGWGLTAVGVFAIRALAGSPPDVSPELPEAEAEAYGAVVGAAASSN